MKQGLQGTHNELSDETAMAILQKMAKQRRDSADIYLSQNRPDLAETSGSIKHYSGILPKQMARKSGKVLKNFCDVGATSMKDMERNDGVATKQLPGKPTVV